MTERAATGARRRKGRSRRRALAVTTCTLLSGCPDEGCEEDARAQVLDDRVVIEIGHEDGVRQLEAELADDPSERERGWRFRSCGREALWLVPDGPPAPLSVEGCGLVEPIDVAFVADDVVVKWMADLQPCGDAEAGPDGCGPCTPVMSPGPIDGVLELPAGRYVLDVGHAVRPR